MQAEQQLGAKEFAEDEACFIRTEDIVCLMCSSGDSTQRDYLAAEGFGSQMCHLETDPDITQKPCELQKCVFKLEDAISVHAMYTHGVSSNKQHGSCKILMYGHAILLRHLGTKELLCSLNTSPESDKMAYDVGFDQAREEAGCVEEHYWFRILPASNQRSEGEKVRAGDDVFLVNVANERYLFAQMASHQSVENGQPRQQQLNSVCVSFYQCVWSLHIVSSGSAKEAAIGNVNGGDVVRFIHRFWGGGDTLVIRTRKAAAEVTEGLPRCGSTSHVQYDMCTSEGNELQSLWRVELFQMKYGGGFTGWGQAFRLRHLLTGMFLGVKLEDVGPDNDTKGPGRTGAVGPGGGGAKQKVHKVALYSPDNATRDATAFCFVNSTTKSQQKMQTYSSGMGIPEVQFGDSEVYLFHIHSKKYLGCDISERRLRIKRDARKALLQPEFHQSFAFSMTRASPEQAKATSILQLSQGVMRSYVDVLVSRHPSDMSYLESSLGNILSALIQYFRTPDKGRLSHDKYQTLLCSLKERQRLFKKQGMLKFTLSTIIKTASKIRENSGAMAILHQLYELLAAMIRGNHENCCEFATKRGLRVFLEQLEVPDITHHVLMVIQCLLTDSPEVLNLLSENDIGVIVHLLNTNGRNSEVMKLLSSLCVCHGVAMRDKQELIYKHLLDCNEILVQTSLHSKIYNLHPDVYVGLREGSAAYRKWYFEVEVTHFNVSSNSSTPVSRLPHLRVGWASATLYKPHPSSNGINTLSGGLGDDIFSVGFDGTQFWLGGTAVCVQDNVPSGHTGPTSSSKRLERQKGISSPDCLNLGNSIAEGDVIGCCVDLESEVVWYTKNGRRVSGHLKLFQECSDLLTPAVSFSTGTSAVLSLGGTLGEFRHTPPKGYAGLYEAVEPGRNVTLLPFRCIGHDKNKIFVQGPTVQSDFEAFVPSPIDISNVNLPDSIESSAGSMRDRLAKNIHEVWAKNKIDAGFTYSPVRNDDLKHSPYLKEFEDLTDDVRESDYNLALSTLKALVSLGYQISVGQEDKSSIRYMDLPPEKYCMSNGYCPRPLDLEGIELPPAMEELVEQLAENGHNIWASKRISEGWTYGKANDKNAKRNPLLVPYCKLDAAAKRSNYSTACESVRTICRLGCTIFPPAAGHGNINQLVLQFSESSTKARTFRGQKCYMVTAGKWYYEVTVLTKGMMRIGWATPFMEAGTLLGSDHNSYAYDGYLSRKWHNESENYGRRWKSGDVIGCLLDMEEKTICFTLNGSLLYDCNDSSTAFLSIDTTKGFVPACTLFAGERASINLGLSEKLKYYMYFENAGYKPLCSYTSLQYNIPLWYSYHGGFKNLRELEEEGSSRFVTEQNCSSITVRAKNWDYSLPSEQEVLRLNMGFVVNSSKALATPTLVPRPGVLSPSLSPESPMGFNLQETGLFPSNKPISFSVKFPSGQVPSSVFLGWTTPSFRYVPSMFKRKESGEDVCKVSWLCTRDASPDLICGQNLQVRRDGFQGGFETVHSVKTAFMVCLSDLLPEINQQLRVPVKVHCSLDLQTGRMTFFIDQEDFKHYTLISKTSECQEVCLELMADEGTKLFPTVVTTPSQETLLTMDLTPAEECRPLSSTFIKTLAHMTAGSKGKESSSIPFCPHRLDLMVHSKSQWVRQTPQSPEYSTKCVGDGQEGALSFTTGEEVIQNISVTLPQEDIVIDMLEMAENLKLQEFYIQTLDTFCAISSHSNLAMVESIITFFDSDQLIQCLTNKSNRFEMHAAFLKLLSHLYLKHEIQTRLLLRGEFILPRSECLTPIPLNKPDFSGNEFSGLTRCTPYRRGKTSHQNSLLSTIHHNVSSSFSELGSPCSLPMKGVRDMVLDRLEKMLNKDYYKMQLLPSKTYSAMFVPVIEAVDNLLVLGELKTESDLQRLLHILDPLLFPYPQCSRKFDKGLLSEEVSCEEPIKFALCVLLQHLCDCQVRHRVESVVSFANGYVEDLQSEQGMRYLRNKKKKPKEFRSSTEMQVESMLSSKSDYNCSKKLRKQLKVFTNELHQHCGGCSASVMQHNKESNLFKKAKKIFSLMASITSNSQPDGSGDGSSTEESGDEIVECDSLRQLVTATMMKWASVEIYNLQLVEEVFSLLYRQFNEMGELVEALQKTYVLEVTKDKKGNTTFDVPGFCSALGSLRLLLTVGMGKKEEKLLKDSLKIIRHSNLFYCHPNLMHKLGVYSTVLQLMKTFLGSSSASSALHPLLMGGPKLTLHLSEEGRPPMPVEHCCKFLCKFAKINHENQRALFKHIGYILECSEKFPGLLQHSKFSPLDIVTATIKDNRELALALEESHLETVVQLLVATTINTSSQMTSPSPRETNPPGYRIVGNQQSCSIDWNPGGGDKCMEFLQTAVWVDNEQIEENAHVIVQQLIHHSECLGPALAGDALGLHLVYREAFQKLAEVEKSSGSGGNTPRKPDWQSSLKRQATFHYSWTNTANDILVFYTRLIRLLAYCACEVRPSNGDGLDGELPEGRSAVRRSGGKASAEHSYIIGNSLTSNRHKQSAIVRTRNILQNLVKTEELVGILSTKFDAKKEAGIHSTHKESVLLFLDRVYGIPSPELLLQLISQAFLPDIKHALQLMKEKDSSVASSLNHYICYSMFPLLSRFSYVFKKLKTDLHIVENFLTCCFRLFHTSTMSSMQLEEVSSFFIAVLKELHPKTMQKFMPKIISSIEDLKPHTVVSCKLLSSHYEHFSRYYQSVGLLDKTSLGVPTEEEKLSSSVFLYRLLHCLHEKLPSDPPLVRILVSCLRSISRALSPSSLIPSLSTLNSIYQNSGLTYEPIPRETSSVQLNSDQEKLVEEFAGYRHADWVFTMQSQGWTYGPDYVEGKADPLIRPYESLPEKEKITLKDPIVEAVKYLLVRGWSLNKLSPLDSHNIPIKAKMVCIRRPFRPKRKLKPEEEYRFYEPEVMDLSRVDIRSEIRDLAELIAEHAHDCRAKKLKETDSNFHSNPLFVSYDLLDENKKEQFREDSLELLRFMRVQGFVPAKLRGSLLARSISEVEPSVNHKKFDLQFFDMFCAFLSSPSENDVDFLLKVLFPTTTSYLQKYVGYFMPNTDIQTSSTTASNEEKLRVIKLFCTVTEFSRKNLSLLFPSAKHPSSKVLSPGDDKTTGEGGRVTDLDNSWTAAKCILALLQAIIQAIDFRVLANRNEQSNQNEEMVDFFRQASTSINLTAKNIGKMSSLDSQFHFYCLNILIPSITTLFKQVGQNEVGPILLQGPIQNHCHYIFNNLVEIAVGSSPVYVGSSPLVTIGQCIGAFALAFPKPFLHNNQFGMSLAFLMEQLHNSVALDSTCGNVLYVVDIVVPVLTSYISRWWKAEDLNIGLHSNSEELKEVCPMLNEFMVDNILVDILTIMSRHFGRNTVSWLTRVVDSSVALASRCSVELFTTYLVPMLEEMKERAIELWNEENFISASWNRIFRQYEEDGRYEAQEKLIEDYQTFVRDLASLLPFISVFLHFRNQELQEACSFSNTHNEPLQMTIKKVFVSLSDIFQCWLSSQYFRREFQTSMHLLAKQARYHLTLKSPGEDMSRTNAFKRSQIPGHSRNQQTKAPNFILLCLELLMPVYDGLVIPDDKPLLEMCTSKLGMKGIVAEDLKAEMISKFKLRDLKSQHLTHKLVKQISRHFITPTVEKEHFYEEKALQILSLAKIKNKIQQAERGEIIQTRWRQMIPMRKKKAVISCFLAVGFYNLAPHRAINLFLRIYCHKWLSCSEQSRHQLLIEELLDKQDYLAHQVVKKREARLAASTAYLQKDELQEEMLKRKCGSHLDPLSQLFKMVQRVATTGGSFDQELYTSYATVLAKTILCQHEEEESGVEDNATGAYEDYMARKAELVSRQIQLAERRAPTTILNVITASNGEAGPMLYSTLQLGIALLKEGNHYVQNVMLHELNSMDVGFLDSISKLISSCSVLDWNAYERYNKSEVVQNTRIEVMCQVLPDHALTISLFRFLQLLCEGHNLSFQNYLRTQAGNTTTINIIVCTVDYLLRLQESISDFYWHYTDYQTIDLSGRENFLKAFKVAKQVFRTLTEYVQGPCVKNQDTLAQSRLWDAVSGFIHVFAVLQRKLYKDTSQLELLRELLGLQEEMFILLLSMLEGSAMSSNIGKLMMDMLMESAHHVDDIMSFFSIFVKLKDSVTSKAFKEYDLNKDGMISYLEFEKAMEAQQRYTKEEIVYLMECADLNNDGLLDYMEFAERFHQPAESIGFHLCVLIVHLTDHLPHDKRIERLKKPASSKELLDHFENNMGCIEILGKSGRIERVYFEVKDTRLKQWKEAQIKASKRTFLHNVDMGSQKNKLKGFMSFCDETIFEMNYADNISGSAQSLMKSKALQHRKEHNRMLVQPQPFISRVRARMHAFQKDHSLMMKALLWLQLLFMFMLRLWPPIKRAGLKILNIVSATVMSYLKRLHQWFSRKLHPSPPAMKKPVKRPPSLKISIPQQPLKDRQQQLQPLQVLSTARASTTVSELPPSATNGRHSEESLSVTGSSLRKRTLPNIEDTLAVSGNGETAMEIERTERRGSFHGVGSGDDANGGLARNRSWTAPRMFSSKPPRLAYNRKNMKRPETSPMLTSSPMEENMMSKEEMNINEDSYIPKIAEHTKSWPYVMARNYFLLDYLKLFVTFLINILLLTYEVSITGSITLADNSTVDLIEPTWTPLVLPIASVVHFILSALLIISYCYLKIPLVIFKREKHIARQLETNHLWISSKPLDTWSDWWDQIVVPAPTFPRNYWDKEFKKRVNKSMLKSGKGQVTRLLGLEVKSKFERRTKIETIMEVMQSMVDIRYCVWTAGVALTNPLSLYHMLYCGLSFIGLHWNFFYFSIHLLDFVMTFKLLRTVLKSVLHNGKQLAMTVLMTCVVIYIYTVIAFNFFRKFYRFQTPEGVEVFKCDNMFECFLFHIDHGVRSGGGIADTLDTFLGDPKESLRLFFDITFFFFVIVILLAIIQGLIIDAFGELRDKEETLSNEMLTKCFVCGLPKSEFDHIPHGFDNHINREHNMAHYMFFLMYLIKKRESEFSGQESYVWGKYLQQSMDFFPLGDCFRSQEERTMASSGEGANQGGSLTQQHRGPTQHHKTGSPHQIRRAQTMHI